jgi:dihydrolipoamide dehydrogenase
MNLIVVGGGPGGVETAQRAARRGHRVTLVERDRLGGTCTNWGCIPTKFLLSAVAAERALGRIPDQEGWRRIQARKRALVEGLSRKIGQDLEREGVQVRRGVGTLVGPGTVLVTSPEGDRQELTAEAVILATGSRPTFLPGIEPDGNHILDSNALLDLSAIPVSLLIVGSGFIGTEFATLFNLLGTRVTMLEALPHILPAEDVDTAAVVQDEFRRKGVTIHTGISLRSIASTPGGVEAVLGDGRTLEADLACIAIGRTPRLEYGGPDTPSLCTDQKGGVVVSSSLETSLPGVYAVGDLTGRLLLAHTATAQAQCLVDHLSGDTRIMEYRNIPYAVFTTPEVASVGLSEQAAQAQGIRFVRGKAPFTGNIKGRLDREQNGFVKILAAPTTGLILGGTVVGPRAADMIHTLSIAILADLTADEVAHGIFVHPTLSESFKDAAEEICRQIGD